MCHKKQAVPRRAAQLPQQVHLPPAYAPVDPLAPASTFQMPESLQYERDLNTALASDYSQTEKDQHQIVEGVVEDKSGAEDVPRRLESQEPSQAVIVSDKVSDHPATYDPTSAALLSSIIRFAAGRGWEKPPTWESGQPKSGPLDMLITTRKLVKEQHYRSRACRGRGRCGHQRACVGCESNYTHAGRTPNSKGLGISLHSPELIQMDLQSFNVALDGVSQGEDGAKGKAKRALRNLKGHLYQIEVSRMGVEFLSCQDKKTLKREVKAVGAEFKQAIKDARRSADR